MGIDNSKIYNKKNRSIIYFKLLVASNVIWNQIMSLKEVDHPEFQVEEIDYLESVGNIHLIIRYHESNKIRERTYEFKDTRTLNYVKSKL